MRTLIKIIKGTFNYFRKRVKLSQLIIFGVGLVLILGGIISWKVYFSKPYTFSKYEEKFLAAVKNFYYYHPEYLPKNGNVKTKKLSELYDENRIEELRVPGSKEICDVDSWVKVYNDNGNYVYHTYLKCGKFVSKADHEGPVITLNGDNTIYLSLNHEYEELGVKAVKDNTDGELDIKNVVIDSSNINNKKVGKYIVTYTIKDSLNNVTKAEREVYVTRNLTDIVKADVKDAKYYKGIVNNNYVLFSGMLFRIVKVNDDGTVLLISDTNINNLRYTESEYENSNIDKFLNDTFLKAIHDDSYIVSSDYCVGNLTSLEGETGACSKKINRKVALLSYDDYNATVKDNYTYMHGQRDYIVANKKDNCQIVTSDWRLLDINDDSIPAIKPVITLKSDLAIASGNGTYDKPYKLNDYSYGKTGSKISTRLLGEYVNYSGMLFRINGIDSNNNIRLMGVNVFKKNVVNGVDDLLGFSLEGLKNYSFKIDEEKNPGYIINNEFIDYISDTNIIKSQYEIPTNDSSKKYSEYTKEKVKSMMMLPATYDLFASSETTNFTGVYLYSDKSTSEESKIFYSNSVNGKVFEVNYNKFIWYGFKPVITIDGNLIIKSGNGTINKPYYVR